MNPIEERPKDPEAPPLSLRAREALVRLFEDISDREVLDYAKGNQDLLRGARKVLASVPTIRTNVRLVLRGTRPLDTSLLRFLGGNSLHQRFVIVLSEHALRDALEDLSCYFHDDHFGAALLLDDRPGVRRLGVDCLDGARARQTSPTDVEREQAARALEQNFGTFLGHIAELEANAGDSAEWVGRGLQAQAHDLHAKLKSADEQLKLERATSAKSKDESARELVALRAERDKLERKLDLTQASLHAEREERQALQGRLSEQEQQIDTAVRARLENELSAQLRPWFQPVRELDAAAKVRAASVGGPQDLLARAESVLRQQANSDPHFGNRKALETRLAGLVAALGETETASRDAIRPLPELTDLITELGREIQSLRVLLNLPILTSSMEPMLARINAASTVEEFEELRRFLDDGADLGAWTRENQRALYRMLDTRFSRLLDAHVRDTPRPPAQVTPLAALREALHRDQSVFLFVDGHNLAHELFASHYDAGHSDKQAREALCSALVRLLECCTQPRVRLYFDGDDRTETEVTPQIMRVFSGGTGLNRADNAILADLEYRLQASPPPPCFLVSSDRNFVRQAQALGALTMRSAEFEWLLLGDGERPGVDLR